MKLDKAADKIFRAAYNEAKFRGHEYFTPEHILYSSLFFDEGKEIVENCGGEIENIKSELLTFFETNFEKVRDKEPIPTEGIDNVVQTAAAHCESSERDSINIGDIIAALFEEKESYAGYILERNGIRKLDILNYISHGIDNAFEDGETDDKEKNEAEADNNFLSKFTINLVERAKSGKIDPLIGREDILNRTIQILARRTKNNPVHVGEPGVGKTAITEGLAAMIANNSVPKILKGSNIFYLDMGALVAGTKYRGDFENRIKKVLNKIEKIENSIVYIDEIHTIVGAGSVSGGALDASNILKPFLIYGKLKFIGSTTYEDYKKYFEKDKALARRFQKIEVPEPSEEETYLIINGLREKYEQFHKVHYTDKALRVTAELAAKYINDKYLPDKAIDVLDETGAVVRLEAGDEADDIVLTINEQDIEKTVAKIAKIPKDTVSENEIDKLKYLEEKLKEQIFGQDDAVNQVTQAIKRSRAGFNDDEKPVSSLLFVGPTGVGKTELAKQLSILFGIPLIRFDMSEYQEKHTVARLIGAPPGYVGYEEGGLLTEKIRKNPYCILLLDEIEKAHHDIFNVLLQVMDYATLTDNNGKKADFRNVILIMTSNAGAKEVGKSLIGFDMRNIDSGIIEKEVEKTFLPEFRNRLDGIIVFNHINEQMALSIAEKAIKQFEEKLKNKNIKLKVTNACYKWIAEKGLSSAFGAREILRVVQENIKTYFVDEVLFGDLAKGGTGVIDVKDGEIIISNE